ncbi:SubName: Full=Uncharacterized protein {ECO:0000313/EMBL:CCA67111.1} [Serendipita indica DSM 11827]|uniref:Metallo-beta-lactamase domain-containing protein n=1 Tax=Serendipita indica (strain DSM 11827) TaxID=1109443 RepID=G4T722_SERID|nr:SubName: Full=Uncharacterized protein {ECO:0000313/EMBL:CCA67111.1} [Serendipita indica DSM 11827]CCA67111.1 hypothetical protein PIIN_00945 [Serendipita indica DSM 11827]
MSTETIIRQLTPSVCIFSRPFKRFGILPVGGRSTAVKLRNGDIWVLASTTLDEPTKAKIDEMGNVKYIVAADAEHDSFLSEFTKAYPAAHLIGVEPLAKKRTDLHFHGAYGKDPEGTKYGYEPEIEACYFPETPNSDVAFFHAESKSLIEADLLWNLKGSSPSLFSLNFDPDSTLHKKFAQFATSDKAATKILAQRVAQWDFDRIIPCHGEVIETGGKNAWKAAYEAFFK